MTLDVIPSRSGPALAEATQNDRESRIPLLSVEGLSKHFEMHHLERRLAAFNDVSFTLHPGEFVLLRGPNGAGKSTLLRTLYRTYKAQGGRAIYQSEMGSIDLVRAADVDMTWLRRTEIGFVTQFLQARPRVSAEEFVAEALLDSCSDRATALEKALRGLSNAGNLSAREAPQADALDVLASDYHAGALLRAALAFEAEGLKPLHEAIAFISSAPAEAVGLKDRGAIAVGSRADLVLVDRNPVPRIRGTMREGRFIYAKAPILERFKLPSVLQSDPGFQNSRDYHAYDRPAE